jgi:hypothetical protein
MAYSRLALIVALTSITKEKNSCLHLVQIQGQRRPER